MATFRSPISCRRSPISATSTSPTSLQGRLSDTPCGKQIHLDLRHHFSLRFRQAMFYKAFGSIFFLCKSFSLIGTFINVLINHGPESLFIIFPASVVCAARNTSDIALGSPLMSLLSHQQQQRLISPSDVANFCSPCTTDSDQQQQPSF